MRQGGEDTLLNWSIRKGNSEGHTNAAKKQNIFSITKRHLSVTLWNVFVGLELCFPLTLSLCLTLVLVSLNASCIHLLSSTLYPPPPSPHPQLLTQHVAYSLRPSTQQRSWASLKACCMKASGAPNSLAHQCKVTDLSSSYWLCHLHKRTNLNKERC